LGGGRVVPRAAREKILELQAPVLHLVELPELPPRRLQAKLNRRVGGVERAEPGELLAELQAAAIPVPDALALGQVDADALATELAGRRARTLRARPGSGFLLERRFDRLDLGEQEELAELLAAAGLAARGIADEPAVSVGRQRMGRVAVEHEEE